MKALQDTLTLAAGETPPAYIDLGLLTIHGRDDLLDERVLTPVELRTAEAERRAAGERVEAEFWEEDFPELR